MNTRTTLRTATTAVALMVQLVLYVSAAGERQQQQQQLPLFFQGSRPFNAPGAPLPKFVGIAGNQQPQAFRSIPPPQVDEELEEDEEQRNDEEPHQRNVLVPTPLPFRPQPTQQVNECNV